MITHFLGSLDRKFPVARQLTTFERLCALTSPQNHLIFFTHSPLFTECQPNDSKACAAWQRDLYLSLTPEEWKKIYLNIYKGSINVSTQENGYKVQSCWYRMPAILHKFKPTISDIYWRCHEHYGSLIHIWWDCPRIQIFWAEVHRITPHVTSYDLERTPAQFLLHHSPLSNKSYHKSLVIHMINAAKQCIPFHWKSQTSPQLKNGLVESIGLQKWKN